MLNKSAIALSFALALGTASTALAASNQWNAGYAYAPQGAYTSPFDAFARAPVAGLRSPPVVEDGMVIGRDPDAYIRRQLERDYYFLVH